MTSTTEPQPHPFAAKKTQLLSTIENDLSPKGSVDTTILPLVKKLNTHPGIATTSSCGGRISIFLEGAKIKPSSTSHSHTTHEEQQQQEGAENEGKTVVGGKGAGGRWVFVSHTPVEVEEGEEGLQELVEKLFGGMPEGEGVYEQSQPKIQVVEFDEGFEAEVGIERRWLHFKFEPMIMHIQTATPSLANTLTKHALTSGFRESGIMNLSLPPPPKPKTPKHSKPGSSSSENPHSTRPKPPQKSQKTPGFPIVAVRSSGMSIDSIIGVAEETEGDAEKVRLLVPRGLLRSLVRMANLRFEENERRIMRFGELVGGMGGEIY